MRLQSIGDIPFDDSMLTPAEWAQLDRGDVSGDEQDTEKPWWDEPDESEQTFPTVGEPSGDDGVERSGDVRSAVSFGGFATESGGSSSWQTSSAPNVASQSAPNRDTSARVGATPTPQAETQLDNPQEGSSPSSRTVGKVRTGDRAGRAGIADKGTDAVVAQWEWRERRIQGFIRSGQATATVCGCSKSNLFRLAQSMHREGVTLEAVADFFPWAVGRLGLDRERAALALESAYQAVRSLNGTDALDKAMFWASKTWERFPTGKLRNAASDDAYRRIGALAYWLHVGRGAQAFFAFPRERIAKWAGVSGKTAGLLIRTLAEHGHIILKSHSYARRDAREAVYTGPDLRKG